MGKLWPHQRNPHAGARSDLGLGTTLSLTGQGLRPSAREILLAISRRSLDHHEGKQKRWVFSWALLVFKMVYQNYIGFFKLPTAHSKFLFVWLIIEVTAWCWKVWFDRIVDWSCLALEQHWYLSAIRRSAKRKNELWVRFVVGQVWSCRVPSTLSH